MKKYSSSKNPRSLDREGCRTVTVGEAEAGVVESPVVRDRAKQFGRPCQRVDNNPRRDESPGNFTGVIIYTAILRLLVYQGKVDSWDNSYPPKEENCK